MSHLGRAIQRFCVSSYCDVASHRGRDPISNPAILGSKGWNQLPNPSVKSPVQLALRCPYLLTLARIEVAVVSNPINEAVIVRSYHSEER